MHRTVTMLIVLAFGLLASAKLTAEPPAWAYPMNPPGYKPHPDDGKAHRVPGSKVSFTTAQTRDLFFAPDWHPNDHAPMPAVVATGRQPNVLACGFCHRATGQGGPENANIAGLPFAYIVQQMRDFRAGARTTALPDRLPQKFMIAGSKDLTDEEINQAAAYFASIKPKKNIRVIETDTIPVPVVANWTWTNPKDGKREPLGQRIIEVPEHLAYFELRDARATFIAYAPKGSVKRGEALVKGKFPARVQACATCHGNDLKGTAIAPPIAGRSASYAMRQLYEFKAGLRTNANAAQMKSVLEKLDDDDMLAIVAYLASRAP